MRLTVPSVITTLLLASAATVQAQVCVAIDETRDTLSAQERTAAVLHVGRQFELAGETFVQGDCPSQYKLSHITLGRTILVRLTGPGGEREGSALGLDDLPALYSQMVRSIVTGRPMAGFNVVDRTNVTAAQSSVERVTADTFWYARLGYGGLFGDRAYGVPSVGFGARVELDSLGLDVSFLNFQTSSYDYVSQGANAGTLLKLQALHYFSPKANRSFYGGGGASWGTASFGQGWSGSGLQGEITAGYELPRASTLRAFVEMNAMLPMYQVSRFDYPSNYNYRLPTPPPKQLRYAPSLTVSMGFGWSRDRHRRD
jgi:hypothetical protein